ncbi:MAG: hypothetical protein Q9174_002292, partial [Haloplaca sp. 1 TL-2023]
MDNDPATAAADPTTQNFQWGTPTQNAQPGGISSPDTPKMTSKAAVGENLAVDPRPKATGAQDPKPTDPAIDGSPDSGANSKDSPGVSNGNQQAPKQGAEVDSAPEQASPQDPYENNHPADPANNDPSSGIFPQAAGSGVESHKALPDGNGDSQMPKEGLKDTPQDPKKDEPPQNPGQPHIGSNPDPESPLPKVVVDTSPVYNVDNHELLAGGPAITINNIPYSLDPSASALLSGTKTINLPRPTPILPAFEVGSQTYTANSASQYVISDQTLIPGAAPIVVDQNTYSLPPSAAALISNGQTLTPAPLPQDHPAITIAGEEIKADTRPRITISGQSLVAGGPTITINNIPFALAPSASALIAGSSTFSLQSPKNPDSNAPNPQDQPVDLASIINAAFTLADQPPAQLTLDSKTYTADALSRFVIDSQTLIPG